MTANLESNMTANYGQGNPGIGAGNQIQGSDARPLVLEFTVDFNGEAYGNLSNFYMELSHYDGISEDQAPRSGMATEDTNLGNGDQGPWTDNQTHRVLAFGAFSAVNLATGATGAENKGAAMFYDGHKWYYTKTATDLAGVNAALWKPSEGGLSVFRMTVKTNSIVLELVNQSGSPANIAHELPRVYKGPFNRISLTMGNSVSGAGKENYADEIELRQGYLILPTPTGACCIRTGLGQGSCSVTTQAVCQANTHGTYGGDNTTCGTNNANCDFCPPVFGDATYDGAVDMEDFGYFQRCLTGPGPFTLSAECTCFDRTNDGDVDADDLVFFNGCASGPAIPADPDCAN